MSDLIYSKTHTHTRRTLWQYANIFDVLRCSQINFNLIKLYIIDVVKQEYIVYAVYVYIYVHRFNVI